MSLRMLLCGALLALGFAAPLSRAAADVLDSLLAGPVLDTGLFERAVLARNPSLGAIRAASRAADAEADRAGAWEDPMVEVLTAPGSFGSGTVDPGYAVSLSQRVPLFGQRGLEGRVARAEAGAKAADVRTARLDLRREARRACYEYRLIGRREAVTVELHELLDQLRKTAVAKYSSGTSSMNDALQADVELAMLDHEQVALARERRVLTARMNALLRREGGPLPAPSLDDALPASPARPDSLLALAIASRPELRSWSEQRRARETALSLARRQRLPDLTLTGRYDRFMEERAWSPQIGLGFNLPIAIGRRGAAEREARAGVEQMELRRQAAAAEIGAELESALAGVQESEHEIHIMRERVLPATERALQAIRSSYENNRADFLALLNAERNLARARLDLDTAETAYLQSRADVDRAVGLDPDGNDPEVER